jgi:hypothetical protein
MLKPATDGELLSCWNLSIVTYKERKINKSFENDIYFHQQVVKAGRHSFVTISFSYFKSVTANVWLNIPKGRLFRAS